MHEKSRGDKTHFWVFGLLGSKNVRKQTPPWNWKIIGGLFSQGRHLLAYVRFLAYGPALQQISRTYTCQLTRFAACRSTNRVTVPGTSIFWPDNEMSGQTMDLPGSLILEECPCRATSLAKLWPATDLTRLSKKYLYKKLPDLKDYIW